MPSVDIGHHHHPKSYRPDAVDEAKDAIKEIDFGCDDGASSSECGGDFETEVDWDFDLALEKNELTCHVFEEDDHGRKTQNKNKTYKLTPVELHVGIKINLDDKYYDERA